MLHYISVACSPTHVRRHILVNTVSVAPVHGSHTPAACVCVSQLTTHTPAARVCVCLSHRLTARTHLLRVCVQVRPHAALHQRDLEGHVCHHPPH